MKEKKQIKKVKPKKTSKYDITVNLSGNPDEGLKAILNAPKSTKGKKGF